jgi:hypothetical protein
MSPTEFAPAAIPATRQATFRSGWTPAFAMIPADQAAERRPLRQGHHRTSPARDTRFGSSQNAEIFAVSWNKSHQTGALLNWPAGTSETSIAQFRRHYL